MAENELSRREFLRVGGALAISTFLPEMQIPVRTSSVRGFFPSEQYLMGDVIKVGRDAFLLRNNRSYQIPDLETYLKNTKFNRFRKGGVIDASSRVLDQYPIEEKVSPSGLLLVPDPVTDEPKNYRPFGGEMLDFYSGIFTKEGIPDNPIIAEVDTFDDLMDNFSKRGFRVGDALFYSHGMEGINRFSPEDTVRDPVANIEFAIARAAKIKEAFPLVQMIAVGHSWGGVIACAVARRHPDLFNSLILINSPVRGISRTLAKWSASQIGRNLMKPFIKEERVIDYLFNLWGNRSYQKDLDKFGREFTGMGKKLIVVIAKNDRIVPEESAFIPGAKIVTIYTDDPGLNVMDYPRQHGLPLKDSAMVIFITNEVGDNLARVA